MPGAKRQANAQPGGCAHPGENSVVRADEGAVLHTDEGAVIRTDAAAVVRTGDGACQRCAPLVLVVGDHMRLGGPDKVEIIRTRHGPRTGDVMPATLFNVEVGEKILRQ